MKKLIEYFKKSASFSNPYAYDNLGKMYYNGLGVSKDYARAKYYFEIAIKQNNSDALFNLAILHYKPSEYYHNYKEAKKYFELAAEKNRSIAQRYFGKLNFNRIGVEKDYAKAKKSFEKASFSKNPDALFDLGKLYFYGLGSTIHEKMSNIEREINEIIVKFDEILFTKPYSILFGRIKSNAHSHKKEIPPITESFYDGLKE